MMTKFKPAFYLFLAAVLLLQACSDYQNGKVSTSISGDAVQIPTAIVNANLPDDGRLRAVVSHLGVELASQTLAGDQTEVSFTLALVPGRYRLAISFEFESPVFGVVALARAQSATIDVTAGQTQAHAFLEQDYDYPNDDNDFYSNLVELQNNTNPNTNNQFFFVVGDNSETGWELYVTDGRPDSIRLVRDINPFGDANPANLVLMNGVYYFTATDGLNGEELWRTDGTSEGTWLVKDINVGIGAGSNPSQLTVAGNSLYFTADDGSTGNELWVSNGMEAGTRVVDIHEGSEGSYPHDLTVLEGSLAFLARETFPFSESVELWKIDEGQVSATKVVEGMLYNLMVAGNTLYFLEFQRSSEDVLWKSNGSFAGTVRVDTVGLNISDLTSVQDGLYFFTEETQWGLWTSVNSASGISQVRTFDGRPSQLTATENGGMYFFMNASFDPALWGSDGSESNTSQVLSTGSIGGFVRNLTLVGSTPYFVYYSEFQYPEVWKYEASNSIPLASFPVDALGTEGRSPHDLISIGNSLYFIADNGIAGAELWKSDGTVSGTQQVMDLKDGAGSGLSRILGR